MDHEHTRTLRDFLATFSFAKPGGIDLSADVPANHYDLAQHVGWLAVVHGLNSAIRNSSEDSWFLVTLNGCRLYLPRFALRVMRHCMSATPDGVINLLVETAHWNEMLSRLSPGSLFLDIGAATGAMSVPFALLRPGQTKIIAFEPSPQARTQLLRTIEKNDAQGIAVVSKALSDEAGTARFIELPLEHETYPWLSEGSRLAASDTSIWPNDRVIDVEVTTLDAELAAVDLATFSNIVLKIDVEGYELAVLRGATRLIEEYRPFMSIDIHHDVVTNELTGDDVKRFLLPYGYNIREQGHVFLCEAPSAAEVRRHDEARIGAFRLRR